MEYLGGGVGVGVKGVEYINLERCQPQHPLRVRVRVGSRVGLGLGMFRGRES